MRYEEGGLDIATIRILAFPVEDLFVQADIIIVDGVIEGNRDHLRHVLGWQISGERGTILGAEAIGKDADRGVAGWRPVRIVVHVCNFQGSKDSPYSRFLIRNHLAEIEREKGREDN